MYYSNKTLVMMCFFSWIIATYINTDKTRISIIYVKTKQLVTYASKLPLLAASLSHVSFVVGFESQDSHKGGGWDIIQSVLLLCKNILEVRLVEGVTLSDVNFKKKKNSFFSEIF